MGRRQDHGLLNGELRQDALSSPIADASRDDSGVNPLDPTDPFSPSSETPDAVLWTQVDDPHCSPRWRSRLWSEPAATIVEAAVLAVRDVVEASSDEESRRRLLHDR